MRIFYHHKRLLFAILFALGSFAASTVHAKTQTAPTIETFTHNIQLQLTDSNGFPVDGTQFWVTLDVIKQGPLVTLQFPVINFQTLASQSAENPLHGVGRFPGGTFIPGGYLYTAAGFLPESIRPTDLVNRSLMGASNNGASETFSFAQAISTLPTPPVGYIVQITSAGAIVIQCAGTFGNIIPVGPQTLLPADITYIVQSSRNVGNNVQISSGSIDTTQFTGGFANAGLRDCHVNDAYNGIAGWAWTDNSMVADKTNGTMNTMVAIGSVDSNGNLQVGTPVQLTNFPAHVFTFDTAVAINRANPNNIVVSYRFTDSRTSPTHRIPCRAVSNDGGKTWPPAWDGVSTPDPLNGPFPGAPTITVGNDNRGVASDKYGNIWYSMTNAVGHSEINYYVSIDGGVNFELLYTSPVIGPSVEYDSPQFAFGGDGLGNYGLHFNALDFNLVTFDGFPVIGFIQINGFNSFGPASTPATVPLTSPAQVPLVNLTQFTNNIFEADIAASQDGRVWLQGYPTIFAASYVMPGSVVFKSPGAINQNYAGPWNYAIFKNITFWSDVYGLPSGVDSQPVLGYLFSEPTTTLYDDQRQALYAIDSAQSPDNSQNMRIPFLISRDNGQTWSNPIDISNTIFANRGFPTMALDTVTGNLIFGWYDGRNDPTYHAVQYFGAVITAAQLDCLVNQIPLSNPLYTIPAPVTS